MRGWTNKKLGQLVDITSSKRIFYEDYISSGVPFYRSKEVIERANNKRNVSTELFISKKKFNDIKDKFGVPISGDLLLTSVGTLGVPYIVQDGEEFYFKDGNLTWFRNFTDGLLNTYLRYWIISPIGRETIDSIAIGSTQSALTIIGLKNIELTLPPLPEQKAIAEVLSSLDYKIDLLHRQNKTLEAMAEALFRQWFVEPCKDELPDGWTEGKLPDEFDFTMGQSPVGTSFNEDGIGMPMFQGNADFGFRFPSERIYTTEPTRYAEPFDTLVSVRAPVGEQNMALVKCCIGRGVVTFRYRNNKNYQTYTYFKIRSLIAEIKQFNDEGTVFGSIGKSDFEALNMDIPPQPLIDNFQEMAKPFDDKVIENCRQICTLEKLRDILLPKLMNGEVRVKG